MFCVEGSGAISNMNGMKCHKPGGLNFTGRDAVCDFGDSDFGLSVIFSRPATGQEFPELGVLPKGEYSVMLLSTMRYPMYELRGYAWAAKYNSDGFMQFKNLKLPFLSPDKSGKRIAFATENGKESVIYLNQAKNPVSFRSGMDSFPNSVWTLAL